MTTSSVFPLLKAELTPVLERGDNALASAMIDGGTMFPPGSHIVTENQPHPFIYRLRTGWAARTRTLDDGRRQIIAVFLPEDLMAVKAMFMERQPDSIVTLTDVVVDRLDCAGAFKLFSKDGAVAARLAFQLAEDERRLHNWIIGLGCADAQERLAFFIVELFGRLKRLGLVKLGNSFSLPMTQQNIGERVGLTVVHVNRVLRRLRDADIVTINARRVIIHNLPQLVTLAQPLFDVFEREAPEYGLAAA